MEQTFLMTLNAGEFKGFLRETLMEILSEMKKDSEQVPDILNIKEASQFLKLQKTTLYEKTSARLIPHFKRGNRLFFKRAELEKWLEEGKIKTLRELQTEAATYSMRHSR